MPRHPRLHAPGLLYHLMARGNNGHPVFLDPPDYEAFLTALQSTQERYPFSLYAYVLMPNHFHLLLEVERDPTSRVMQAVLTSYARRFNRVHQRRGHVFQGRYKAIVCQRDPYLLALVRYIHLNPVRTGLVKRPGDWCWSGHAEYLGQASRGLIAPGPVRGYLATPGQYAAFVRAGSKEQYRAEWHPPDSAPFVGTERFVKQVRNHPEPIPVRRTPALAALWAAVAKQAGVSAAALRSGGRSVVLVKARERFIGQAILAVGYRAVAVASFIGCQPSTVSRALQKAGTGK